MIMNSYVYTIIELHTDTEKEGVCEKALRFEG